MTTADQASRDAERYFYSDDISGQESYAILKKNPEKCQQVYQDWQRKKGFITEDFSSFSEEIVDAAKKTFKIIKNNPKCTLFIGTISVIALIIYLIPKDDQLSLDDSFVQKNLTGSSL